MKSTDPNPDGMTNKRPKMVCCECFDHIKILTDQISPPSEKQKSLSEEVKGLKQVVKRPISRPSLSYSDEEESQSQAVVN